ncbi:60S ribosomal protein L37 [Histoplasma ohiense]
MAETISCSSASSAPFPVPDHRSFLDAMSPFFCWLVTVGGLVDVDPRGGNTVCGGIRVGLGELLDTERPGTGSGNVCMGKKSSEIPSTKASLPSFDSLARSSP